MNLTKVQIKEKQEELVDVLLKLDEYGKAKKALWKAAWPFIAGVVGYTGAVAASDGFLKVVGPGGTSNAIPCGFAM